MGHWERLFIKNRRFALKKVSLASERNQLAPNADSQTRSEGKKCENKRAAPVRQLYAMRSLEHLIMELKCLHRIPEQQDHELQFRLIETIRRTDIINIFQD